MSVWELPTSLEIGGVGYFIRSDFRAVLDILKYYADPEYEPDERNLICLMILYPDWEDIPQEHWGEAIEKAKEFIDAGMTDDGKRKPTLMDWEQDAPIIIPAVNNIAGCEVRAIPNLHWWTFLGYYMEIRESLFSSVVDIRHKKQKGKKLEKYEEEFYRENKKLITLKKKETAEETAAKNEIRELFGYRKR